MSYNSLQLANSYQKWSNLLLNKSPDSLMIAQMVAKLVKQLPTYSVSNPPTTRIVGGFVRDSLLGTESLDIDIEVYGVKPFDLLVTLTDAFPQHLRLVGKSYEVIQIKTYDGYKIEVNMPRSRWDDQRKIFFASDPLRTPDEALRSKEFVCSSAQACPITGEIFDPLNSYEDFKMRRLEVLEEKNFFFNPLCVFRVLHFNSRFGLVPTKRAVELMTKVVTENLIDLIHPRRITSELEKVFVLGSPPSSAIKLMNDCGLLEYLFPLVVTDEVNFKRTLKRVDLAHKFVTNNSRLIVQIKSYEIIYIALFYDSLRFILNCQSFNSLRDDELNQMKSTLTKKINRSLVSLGFEEQETNYKFSQLIATVALYGHVTDLNQSSKSFTTQPIPSTNRLKPRTKPAEQPAKNSKVNLNHLRIVLTKLCKPFVKDHIKDLYTAIQLN